MQNDKTVKYSLLLYQVKKQFYPVYTEIVSAKRAARVDRVRRSSFSEDSMSKH